jgi:hypothetical protein
MNTTLSEQLLSDIRGAYGSLETPNWSFKEKRYKKEPYNGLVKSLAKGGAVQETTDLNDDVSVVVFVGSGNGNGVSVRLSLVGKYACLSNASGVFLSQNDMSNDIQANKISEKVTDEGVILLNPEELAKRIEFGEGMVSVYEILFSRDEAIE